MKRVDLTLVFHHETEGGAFLVSANGKLGFAEHVPAKLCRFDTENLARLTAWRADNAHRSREGRFAAQWSRATITVALPDDLAREKGLAAKDAAEGLFREGLS
ncbi:hypothetical protein [Afifella sp. IM 167]|uniref:hypothetical protein n=1 Tax=Afifella sp. IM 167 TaxID=2033586 RepID=UPI001CCCD9B6|nr:hypothetical protein [Afifella sp. IM 167]MBZ8133257.1 hypothetical protein [Afifella sp. IM 167]